MPSQHLSIQYLLTCLTSTLFAISSPSANAKIEQDPIATLSQTNNHFKTDRTDNVLQKNSESSNSSSSRTLTIAMIMPSDKSPLLDAAQKVSNGLIAASKTSSKPANILILGSKDEISASQQVQAAIINGADVIVGPIQREKVEEIASMQYLPIPVVALNAISETASTPENLVMMSIASEQEAQYIARLAIEAMPEKEKSEADSITANINQQEPEIEAPSDIEDENNEESKKIVPAKVAILKTDSAWSERVTQAYLNVLNEKGIPARVINVSKDNLEQVQRTLAPELNESELAYFEALKEKTIESAKEEKLSNNDLKRKLKKIKDKLRVTIATSEPPYPTILLALGPEKASLVKSRIPLKSRVWATSVTNPGDPTTSSASAALAYDLNNIVFSECPIVEKYDASTFEARFETAMPYSPSAKRLFALGVDAFTLAELWATKQPSIQFIGETGVISLDKTSSSIVNRIPQTMVLQAGHLIDVSPKVVAKPGALPTFNIPKKKSLPDVETSYRDIKRTLVVPVKAESLPESLLEPTKPITPLKIEQ